MFRVSVWAASPEPWAGTARRDQCLGPREPCSYVPQTPLIPLFLSCLRPVPPAEQLRGAEADLSPELAEAAVPPRAALWQERPALPRQPESGAPGEGGNGERRAPARPAERLWGSRARKGGAQARELSGLCSLHQNDFGRVTCPLPAPGSSSAIQDDDHAPLGWRDE